jgi:hypothetical protein
MTRFSLRGSFDVVHDAANIIGFLLHLASVWTEYSNNNDERGTITSEYNHKARPKILSRIDEQTDGKSLTKVRVN